MFFVHIFKYVFSVQFQHYIAVSALFFWAFLRVLGAFAVVGLSCYMSEPFGRSAAFLELSVCGSRLAAVGCPRLGCPAVHRRRVLWWASVLLLSVACLHRRSLSGFGAIRSGMIRGRGGCTTGDICADGGGANNPLSHPKNKKSRKTC